MKVKKTAIPSDSLTRNYLPVDYSDVYVAEVATDITINPDDIMVNFWLSPPAWVDWLFKIRNALVKLVGLKGSKDQAAPNKLEEMIREGGSNGLFSSAAKNQAENVMLLTDKHLDAYISVFVQNNANNQSVYTITLVNFHNRLGRVYFFIIKPFHGLVVKQLLKRAIKKVL